VPLSLCAYLDFCIIYVSLLTGIFLHSFQIPGYTLTTHTHFTLSLLPYFLHYTLYLHAFLFHFMTKKFTHHPSKSFLMSTSHRTYPDPFLALLCPQLLVYMSYFSELEVELRI